MFRVRFELMFNKSAANVFLGGDAIISVTPQTFFSRTQLQNSITIFEKKVFLEIYFFLFFYGILTNCYDPHSHLWQNEFTNNEMANS